MSNFAEFLDEINDKVATFIQNAVETDASKIGLDRRAGSEIYVGEDFIAVSKYRRGHMDYYGGFEYVNDECVMVFGDYVFYMIDSNYDYYEEEEWTSVKRAIEYFNKNHKEG